MCHSWVYAPHRFCYLHPYTAAPPQAGERHRALPHATVPLPPYACRVRAHYPRLTTRTLTSTRPRSACNHADNCHTRADGARDRRLTLLPYGKHMPEQTTLYRCIAWPVVYTVWVIT